MTQIPECVVDFEARRTERDYELVLDECYREKTPQYAAPKPVKATTIDPHALTAGECVLTITRDSDGKSHSFRIRKFENMFFIDYNIDASGRLKDWQYLGVFQPNAIHCEDVVRLTTASGFDAQSLPYQVACRFMLPLMYGMPILDGFHLSHTGKCSNCGNVLAAAKA